MWILQIFIISIQKWLYNLTLCKFTFEKLNVHFLCFYREKPSLLMKEIWKHVNECLRNNYGVGSCMEERKSIVYYRPMWISKIKNIFFQIIWKIKTVKTSVKLCQKKWLCTEYFKYVQCSIILSISIFQSPISLSNFIC